MKTKSIFICICVQAGCFSALHSISKDFLPPEQWIDDLQCVGVCIAEAAPFVGFTVFVSTCTCIAAAGLRMSLCDDSQRKCPCDWVKDHGAWGLGDGPAPTHIESDQSGNIVKAILLELEQLPRVALSHRWKRTRNISSWALKGIVR